MKWKLAESEGMGSVVITLSLLATLTEELCFLMSLLCLAGQAEAPPGAT